MMANDFGYVQTIQPGEWAAIQRDLARLRRIEELARELLKFARPFQKTIGGASFWRAWEALREALKE